LPTDSDPTVRETVAAALGYLRAASAINSMIATLNQPDEERKVRQADAKALGAIGCERAIDALLTTLGDTQADLNLRSSASDALKQIGDPAIPPLLTKLQAADLRSRYWAVVALAEMNSSASTQALQSNQAQVDQILADADKAGIVEYDRVPVTGVNSGTRCQLLRGRHSRHRF
jgi:HEAT repeat protein